MPNRLFDILSALSLMSCMCVLLVWDGFPGNYVAFGVLIAVLAILPVWWFFVWQRHDGEQLRRIDYGLCRGCGYDLRGSMDRCPECGREFKPHEKVKIRTGDTN